MTPFHILTTYAVLGVSIALVCTLAARLPTAAAFSLGRVSSLDGLRALLALSVLANHMVVTWVWHTTGAWQTSDSRWLTGLGTVPVSLFFMITAYLFTRKMLKGEPAWGALLTSRLKRIMPMYGVSVLIIALIAFWQSWPVKVELSSTAAAFASWLVFVRAPFNDFAPSLLINSSVQWTLLYEALFYLSLPLLYVLIRRRLPLAALGVSVLLLACLWPHWGGHVSTRILRLFMGGIAVALLEDWLRARDFDYRHWRWSALALLALAAALLMRSYSKGQLLLLTIPFALFVLGNTLGGLLTSRGLRLLGDASFSIYLLHGIVLYGLFSVLHLYGFEQGGYVGFILYMPLAMLVTCAVSLLTWQFIERPAMAWRPARAIDGNATGLASGKRH